MHTQLKYNTKEEVIANYYLLIIIQIEMNGLQEVMIKVRKTL